MRFKTNVVLHERLEVPPVLPHVVDNISPVEKVVLRVSLELVTKSPEETVAIPRDLLESEAQGAKLVVETGEIIEVLGHVLLLFLVPPVGCPDLSLNSLLGHFQTYLLWK